MTTSMLRPTASVLIDGDDFQAEGGSSVTLDAGAVPYARATVELPLLSDALIDYLDPRDLVRCPVTGGDAVTGVPRTFNLGLRARTVDHTAKQVTLELASDEAMVMDYATMSDDYTPRTLESSLRSVVDYVLGLAIPGAALEAGTDANVTRYWELTNLVPNPQMTVNVANWGTGSGASSLVRATFGSVATAQWTAAAGTSNIIPATTLTAYAVRPGRSYVFAFDIRSSVARNARAAIQWRTGGGAITHTTVYGAAITTNNTGLQRAYVIATAPPGADFCQPFVNTAGNVAGNLHYVTNAMFYEGDELVSYFSGLTTDTATYSYDWADTAQPNNSASIRTPLVSSPGVDALTWKAGQSAWDFLLYLTASVNMVLWCDENRDWRLQTPESRTIAQQVYISGLNARSGSDTIDRDDTEAYVTGVVLRYQWTDADGNPMYATDSAGTATKVLVQEVESPYPGPGAAANMLARRQGTGRVQEAVSITDWTTTPGMGVQYSLPGAPDILGRVSGVEFYLADGFMAITAAGLVDIVPGSIGALAGTIASLPGTIASL